MMTLCMDIEGQTGVRHMFKADVLAEVQKILQAGVIKPSTSQWSFPIVPVKNGSFRIYFKSKKLNMLLLDRDAYPIPRID